MLFLFKSKGQGYGEKMESSEDMEGTWKNLWANKNSHFSLFEPFYYNFQLSLEKKTR